jgi:hypothetical protein
MGRSQTQNANLPGVAKAIVSRDVPRIAKTAITLYDRDDDSLDLAM